MKILSEEQRERLYAAQANFRRKNREKKLEYLKTHPCVDCGEADPIVLEFDHRDPKEKRNGISRLMSGHTKWENLLKEVAKCDVRCANCHRRKTYKQFEQNPTHGNRGRRRAPVA